MPRLKFSLIDVEGNVREEPPGELEKLMESIKEHGLLQPITVAPSPHAKGRYVVVFGRRRLKALVRLGIQSIRVKIRPYDTILNEKVEISENFHRLELTALERERAVVRYAELTRIQLATNPPTPAPPPPVERPPITAPPVPRSNGTDGHRPQGEGTRRGPEPAVVAAVAEQLGVAPRTVQRDLRRADALTEFQRGVLERAGIRGERLDQIVALTDVEQRNGVVNLIGDGLTFNEAMTEVLEENFRPSDEDFTDEEWLATLPLSSREIDQRRFRADALLYRKIQRVKIAFARDLGWEELKETHPHEGLYFRRLMFFLDCPHPRDWIKCLGCTAGIHNGREHQTCRGCGYLTS